MIETSNMFAGFQEQETTQQADKSQRKHRWQPNFDVHSCVPLDSRLARRRVIQMQWRTPAAISGLP
jgi:hypothetical protein